MRKDYENMNARKHFEKVFNENKKSKKKVHRRKHEL